MVLKSDQFGSLASELGVAELFIRVLVPAGSV